MNVRLIGRIQSMAVEAFVRLLNYERFIIAKNATESFFPKKSELYSNWLLDIDGTTFIAAITLAQCRLGPLPTTQMSRWHGIEFLDSFRVANYKAWPDLPSYMQRLSATAQVSTS